jgi:asparagine synthase (glutamine-hydrolysing)
MLRRFEGDYAGKDLLKQLSYCEQEIYLRNQLLRDLGMVGVACDLDVRLPFADKDLVEAVWSLPASAVFLEGRPKTFLIECVKDVLPIEAYDRPKLGFVLPIGHWLSGAISSRLEELSAKTGLLEQLGIDPTTLKAIARDCAGAREKIFYNREWCLFVLLDWCARHL